MEIKIIDSKNHPP